MKIYTYRDKPIKVFGVPFFEETQVLERVPEKIRNSLPKVYEPLGRRCPGGRVAFKTNAEEFTIELTLESLSVDVAMSLYSCQSAEVFVGDRSTARFAGLVSPSSYENTVFQKTFKKDSSLEDITIFLPRNEHVENLKIIIPDNAVIEPPTPYKFGPVLFYGSSITEGGCSTRVSNGYNAILSNKLDIDYYNFGFSGSAKGELIMADYINTIDIKGFVYDYDYNAPTAEHLDNTHEAFFKRIREKNPQMPIIIMSRLNFDIEKDISKRKSIIYNTYKTAADNGDKNVYFIDGEKIFNPLDSQACSIDTIHPNDLGFYRMAQAIEPVIRLAFNIE